MIYNKFNVINFLLNIKIYDEELQLVAMICLFKVILRIENEFYRQFYREDL